MIIFYFIFFALMVVYAILISYYHGAWNELMKAAGTATNSQPPLSSINSDRHSPEVKISVVIAMRNEAANFPALIQSLKSQVYPLQLLEIIIIDDHSDDITWQLIYGQMADGFVTGIRMQDNIKEETSPVQSYKKKAIESGISLASGELIVVTDADCRFGPQWLTTIADHYQRTGSVFIAAPVTYEISGGFLSVFETLDFLTLQGITGASVFKKFHTMCNGANLAYTKAAFDEVNGFAGIDHIPSGDDMLLMHKIFKKWPDKVSYLSSKDAIVTTKGATSWKAFFNQRIRWASKATHYDDKRILWVLVIVYTVNVCFLIAAIGAFFKTNYLVFFVLMLVAKVLIEFPFVNRVSMFFGQQRLMRYFPFMQPFHILYTIIAGWLGKFGSYEWKGRKITNNGKRIQGT